MRTKFFTQEEKDNFLDYHKKIIEYTYKLVDKYVVDHSITADDFCKNFKVPLTFLNTQRHRDVKCGTNQYQIFILCKMLEYYDIIDLGDDI